MMTAVGSSLYKLTYKNIQSRLSKKFCNGIFSSESNEDADENKGKWQC